MKVREALENTLDMFFAKQLDSRQPTFWLEKKNPQPALPNVAEC